MSTERAGKSGLLSLLHCLGTLAAEAASRSSSSACSADASRRIPISAAITAATIDPAPPGWSTVDVHGPPGAPRAPAAPIQITNAEEQTLVIRTSTNGGGSLAPATTPEQFEPANGRPDHRPPATSEVLAVPMGAAEPAAPPAAGDRVAEVMLRHQEVMQQFLETQRTVMLGYLGAGGAAAAVRPALGAPRRAMQALPETAAPVAPAAPVPVAPATPPPAASFAAPEAPAASSAVTPAAAPAQSLAAPAAAVDSGTAAVMTREQIRERLLALVSERTGYPAEMLELDADLEGDLGIDSIKRVEIAGTFTQSLAEADRGAIDIEELTASKTLTAVIDTLEAALGKSAGRAAPRASRSGGTTPF